MLHLACTARLVTVAHRSKAAPNDAPALVKTAGSVFPSRWCKKPATHPQMVETSSATRMPRIQSMVRSGDNPTSLGSFQPWPHVG